MKLTDALVCLDCEELVHVDQTACNKCGSHHLYLIFKWLEKKLVKKLEERTRQTHGHTDD